MSLATLKGEGNGAAIGRYELHYRKNQPFLQRNVRLVLRFLTMGSALSSLKPSPGPRSRDEVAASSDEEDIDDIRPAKRRKTGPFSSAATWSDSEFDSRRPFGQVANERARAQRPSSKIQAVQPSDFYGKYPAVLPLNGIPKRVEAKSKSTKSSLNTILPPKTAEFKRQLRLDITSIVRKPTTEDESATFAKYHKAPVDVQCKCSVALFGKNDDDPAAPISSQNYEEMFRKSSVCTLRTTLNEEGEVVREFINLDPFIVSADEIFIDRKISASFDFAEKYYVQIIIKPSGFPKEWPPFDVASLTTSGFLDDDPSIESNPVTDLLQMGKATNNNVHLTCKTTSLLDPERQNRSVDLKLSYGNMRQNICYGLRLIMKWSLPTPFSDLPTRNIKIEPETPPAKIVSATSISEQVPASLLARKGGDVSAPNSPADSRAQRRRANVPTYNLKTLSTLQQGKSPRVHKNRDFRSNSAQERPDDADGITVTYTFGKADAAELGVKRETTVVGLACPFCQCQHRSVDDLRLHFHMVHGGYKLSLRRSSPPRLGFFVELAKQCLRPSPSPFMEPSRTLQLSKPRTLFDLDRFLNGDICWVKSRQGPQHNTWPDHFQDRVHESSLSSSPRDSRHSSPNTSNDTDDLMDPEYDHEKLSIRPRKKFYVPKTSKPLYDTITKQVLEPGQEIPSSDDEKDEGWLHQKHRDIILDFTDVTDDEKDYIIRWNPFIMEEHLTCEAYLPDAILRFVEANKFWFAQKMSRKGEFLKSMETFMMRGVVPEKCFQKCIDILRAAEKMERSKEKGVIEDERPVSPAKLRGMLDCECGEHTQPSDRVICRGQVSTHLINLSAHLACANSGYQKCPGRFFHRDCAGKSGRLINGAYYCHHCLS